MTTLKVDDFSGEFPILSPLRLPQNLAQTAIDCKFVDGNLRPFLALSGVVQSLPYGTESIYWYDRRLWISRTHDMDVVMSPIVNDTIDRVYKTEEGEYPEMSFDTQIDAGNWFRLGVPVPSHGPTLADTYTAKSGIITKILSQSEFDADPGLDCSDDTCATTGSGPLVVYSSGHGLDTDERVKITMPTGTTFLDGRVYNITKIDDDHFSLSGSSPNAGFPYDNGGSWVEYRDESEVESRGYAYTFVTDQGEEGPPSPITTIDVYSDSVVNLTDIADDYDPEDTGDYSFGAAALKRIYRSVTSATGTKLHFIGEIEYSDTVFSDDIDPAEIGEPLPSESWDAPPEDMRGLVSMPNGILAGFSGRDICFSVAYMPHAWPIEYRINVDSDIVAFGVFGQNLVVATKEKPYIVSGIDPASMMLEKMEINQSCVSKRGMVDMGYSVVYPSPDGLIEIRQGQVTNITKEVFSREQWQALRPETMRAYANEGRYFFSTDVASYSLDPRKPTMTKHSITFEAGFTDIQDDKLFILTGTELFIFEGGTGRQEYTWKSKKFRLPYPTGMAAANIFFDGDYDGNDDSVEFFLYADGSLIFNGTVADNSPFRLPSGSMASEFEFQLTGKALVESVSISTSISELRAV